jgi:TRAP-type C4-dicarboxylate transport system permease small subunit
VIEAAHSHLGPNRCPAPIRLLARLGGAIALAEGAAIGVALGALVMLATWQFVARNLRPLGLPAAPLWIDSCIRHAVFFIGFLGAAFATHVIKHLRVDAVTRVLPVRLRLGVRMLTSTFACVVCYLLLRAGWAFHADIVANEGGDLSQAGELITAARGTLALPVGFALILLHFAVQIVVDGAWVLSGETPPAAWLAEAHAGEDALETATVLSEDL